MIVVGIIVGIGCLVGVSYMVIERIIQQRTYGKRR